MIRQLQILGIVHNAESLSHLYCSVKHNITEAITARQGVSERPVRVEAGEREMPVATFHTAAESPVMRPGEYRFHSRIDVISDAALLRRGNGRLLLSRRQVSYKPQSNPSRTAHS